MSLNQAIPESCGSARARVRSCGFVRLCGGRRQAHELDSSAEEWSDSERRQWLAAFWGELAQYLAKWQCIKMRHGPGENITFEKAVSR